MNMASGLIYVTHSERLRGSYEALFTRCLLAIAYSNPQIVCVEAIDAIGGQLYAELQSRRNGVRAIRPKTSKRARQVEILNLLREKRVYLRESIRESFNPRKRDTADCIDALTQGLILCKELRANHQTMPLPVAHSGLFG